MAKTLKMAKVKINTLTRYIGGRGERSGKNNIFT